MSEKNTTTDQNWLEGTPVTMYSETPCTPSRRRLLHLLGASGLAGLAGCSQTPEQGTETGTDAGTEARTAGQKSATIAIPSSVTRDGAGTHGVIPYWTRIIEPLAWPDSEMNVTPWLAKSWEQTGEKKWVFTLRDGVEFHNGDKLDADAVLFSLRKMLTDQPWTKGWLRMTPGGVKKVEELTVEITNSKPMPRLPGALAHIWHSIQHPESPPGWGGTIGTGPYKLEELRQDQYAIVSPFDNYWGGTPNPRKLTFRTIKDQNTRDLALESGEVDIAFDISPSQRNELDDSDKLRAEVQPLTSSVRLLFNNTEPPTDDIKLRKALNFAVSQEAVIDGALSGIGEPARGSIPSILWWSAHDSLPEYGPDKAKAKDLVDRSDYDGETVHLVSSSSPHRVNGPTNPKFTAQIVQQAAADIGVNVEIRMMEQAAFSKAEETGEGGHMFQGHSYTIAAKPGDFINDFVGEGTTSPGPQEFDKEVKERLNAILDEGISASTNEAAKRAFSEAERILVVEEVIMVPLYYKHYIVGQDDGIEGAVYHPTMRHSRFENMTITE